MRSLIAVALAGLAWSATAQAQGSILLQGLADAEFWSTSATSNLLTRNNGKPGGLGRLQLWGAAEPVSGLVFYAQGRGEGGNARNENQHYEIYLEQFGVRYTPSRAFVVDAGRLAPVIGEFAARRFSNRNPLIGEPDAYSAEYPTGAEISGEAMHFDYRAAVISLPATHVNYVPSPTARYRPAVAVGFTPFIGLHVGAAYTDGPYLNDEITGAQAGGRIWSAYHQRLTALNLQFARGYLETHAELARASYDVPTFAKPIVGYTYYGEAKYTFSPRFFTAVRIEQNDYPFIRPISATAWISKLTDFADAEAGIGYRLGATTLLKASVRGDRWWIAPNSVGFLGTGGHAVALQLSQAFDVMDWFSRQQ